MEDYEISIKNHNLESVSKKRFIFLTEVACTRPPYPHVVFPQRVSPVSFSHRTRSELH
jgi:hypothetical protein